MLTIELLSQRQQTALLVPQSLDGIHVSSPQGRVEAE